MKIHILYIGGKEGEVGPLYYFLLN